jgi:hypothetical protein
MASLTLGLDDLPLPGRQGISLEYIPFGGQRRMLDGTMRVDIRGYKHRWTLRWEGLTQTERNALFASYGTHTYTQATVVMPDGQTATVLAGTNSWREEAFYDFNDDPYYDVTFNLDQI